MPPDKKKIAAACLKKGTEAMARENWDYAIDMFSRAVGLVPENLFYRQSLRGVQERKYNNNKTGAKMAGIRLVKVRTKIKKSRLTDNWEDVNRLAEEGLAVNPWDPHLNADLGAACSKLGYIEVALFGYRNAVQGDRDNKAYNRLLGLMLEDRGEYAEAIQCWERIRKLDPLDGEARSKVTDLHAKQTTDRGGYDDATTTRDVKTGYDYDRPVSGSVPNDSDGPGVSEEADLQYAIRKDPTSKEPLLQLADLYRRERRLDDAAEILQQAFELSGGDPNIRELMEDLELDRMRHNLGLAREAAKSETDGEKAKANTVALAKELLSRETEVLSSRVDRYPADMKLKFELAQRLMRQQKFPQAIPHLQKASADSRLQSLVLVSLGKCFISVKKEDLARRQFEKAIPEINQKDSPAAYCEANYLLARLYEKSGNREKSEQHYSEVISVDYEYRDAVDRLEKLQGGDSDA